VLRDYQQAAHDAAIEFVRGCLDPCLIEAATGCHAKGHGILMYDGSIKKVEDIETGDKIAGPDGTARTVKQLHRGEDIMYKISPVKGEPFVVNSGHILSLYRTKTSKNEQIGYCEISVKDYVSQNAYFKHLHKLQRCRFEFKRKDLPVDPYVVGVLIGDGCLTGLTPSFCIPDKEVIDYIESWAKLLCCSISIHSKGRSTPNINIVDHIANRSKENRVRALLKEVGIYFDYAKDKKIPFLYKTGDRNQQLELLAGLLDTDGHLSGSGYDWISKSEQLADDVVFICRSLGLAAYKKQCIKSCQNGFSGNYFRVSISGDCSIIPTKIPRKQSPKREQIKNVCVTGFTVEPLARGDYYGFTVDKDHLYLDCNYVRHHNSGKSHIIGALAETLNKISKGKKILCLAPSAELVIQNREKYLATGKPASIFSSSAGGACLRHPVVFGTPGTVKNKIQRFSGEFCAVIIDEAHKIAPTIKTIIQSMRECNDKLRVIGLSATPYRLGSGYIYSMDEQGNVNDESKAREPYFLAKVFTVSARDLLSRGFLTEPVIGALHVDGYETLNMQLNSMGQFAKDDIDQAYHGHGRKTAAIVADVVMQSQNRNGVMFFAATVQHAKEILASLPPGLSALVTSDTKSKDRARILTRFKAREIKYLVNVSVLTTGFDAPHVDVIAILRATESVALLQQIIGRGMRIDDGKDDCLVLDYAENIERHCPDGDVFNPTIKAAYVGTGAAVVKSLCPSCGYTNEFAERLNDDGFGVDENGYFLDVAEQRIETQFGDMPAHFGRRCWGQIKRGPVYERCSYRWTFKPCPHCEAENDIAARYCIECKGEIVDPNEKLRAEFKALKRDPTRMQTDNVLEWTKCPGISRAGNEVLRVDYVTEYRTFSIWYTEKMKRDNDLFLSATNGGIERPKTLTYKKDITTGFYRIYAYNQEADNCEI
jgi:DNA repair protein RadD